MVVHVIESFSTLYYPLQKEEICDEELLTTVQSIDLQHFKRIVVYEEALIELQEL